MAGKGFLLDFLKSIQGKEKGEEKEKKKKEAL